jgi:hypothetical protein
MPRIAIVKSDSEDYIAILHLHLNFTEVSDEDLEFVRLALGYGEHLVIQDPPVTVEKYINKGKEIQKANEARILKQKEEQRKRDLARAEKSTLTKAEKLKKQLIAGKKAQEELERLGVTL